MVLLDSVKLSLIKSERPVEHADTHTHTRFILYNYEEPVISTEGVHKSFSKYSTIRAQLHSLKCSVQQ